LDVGANTLAGTDPSEVVKKTDLMLNENRDWENPFGDGKSRPKNNQNIEGRICLNQES